MGWCVYVASAAVIAGVSLFLIVNHQYEDGILGRLALVILLGSNALIVWDWASGCDRYSILPNTLATQAAMALFLSRHVYRFLRWKNDGSFEWRPAHK